MPSYICVDIPQLLFSFSFSYFHLIICFFPIYICSDHQLEFKAKSKPGGANYEPTELKGNYPFSSGHEVVFIDICIDIDKEKQVFLYNV